MNKKAQKTKVLKQLGGGHSVKMLQKMKEVKIGKLNTRQIESSSIGLFKGKTLILGSFKTVEDAVKHFNELK